MTPASDPFRTLGLEPGATPAEIKRAYRKLAKAYHPDSAGERALPRFLAIQAAYERLTSGSAGGSGSTTRDGSRRTSRSGPAAPPPSRPWSADAERARATRDAFRQRSTRAGARPGANTGAGSGPSGGAGGSGAGPAAGAPAGGRPPSGRASGRRGRPKATIGSTSYDGTENEPFEPGWSGATWYGAASGTYWTINPKEYADPRKHGPEYLARARRNPQGKAGAPAGRSSGAERDGPETAPAAGDRPDSPPSAPAGAGPAHEPTPTSDPASATQPRGDSGRAEAAGRGAAQPGSSVPTPRPGFETPGDRRASATPAAPAGPPTAARDAVRLRSLQPRAIVASWRGRLVLAAIAWFPIGLAIFGIHGQLTGCSQFLATCTDPVSWSVWIPQLIAFGLLLASPRLSWIAASGSVLLLCVTVPLAAVLTAGSGGHPPSTATTELLYGAMSVGWLAGVAIALSGRIPLPPWRMARVR